MSGNYHIPFDDERQEGCLIKAIYIMILLAVVAIVFLFISLSGCISQRTIIIDPNIKKTENDTTRFIHSGKLNEDNPGFKYQ